MRVYTIHKPTHELLDANGSRVGVIQKRGDYCMINLANGWRRWAVGGCCYHLTGYGDGVAADAPEHSRDSFFGALAFLLGADEAKASGIYACREV